MNLKNTVTILFIIMIVLSPTSFLFAENQAVWIEGKVTRKPWRIDSHSMIEVDWKPYKILSDIRVTHRYLRNKGAYDEKISNIYSIYMGQKITMKVKKKEVIQIILY